MSSLLLVGQAPESGRECSSQHMKAKAPEFLILRTPNTTSLTACRLCDNFFDVLNPRALCYHIASCTAAMQSTKPTHSEKLPGTQGGKLYNLRVLPATQLRQLLDFILDNNYFLTADVLFLSQHLPAASTQTPCKQLLIKTTYCNVG